MMLQDKKIDKDDILKYCEITIDVVTGVFHWLMCKFCSNGTPILKSAVHSF